MIPGSAENQCQNCVHLLSIISVSVLLYHMYPWYPISKFHSMNQISTSTNVFYQVTLLFTQTNVVFLKCNHDPLFGMFLPLFSTSQTYIFFKGTWHNLKSSKAFIHSTNLSLMSSVPVTKLNFIVHALRVSALQRVQNSEHKAGTNYIWTG